MNRSSHDRSSPTRSTVRLRSPAHRSPGRSPSSRCGQASFSGEPRPLCSTSGGSSSPRSSPRLAVLPDASVGSLAALAHEVRLAWCGPEVEVEGILSAKTGGCPEDCHFCSQSARFGSPVAATPFLDADEVLAAAEQTAALGASEFCIVLAVRGPDEQVARPDLLARPGRSESAPVSTSRSPPGSSPTSRRPGSPQAGVHRYNHNLETARSFFGEVVTTHTWEERAETCRLVVDHGMELCCGALLGMGESDAQRVELIGQLADARPDRGAAQLLEPPARHAPRRPAGRRRRGTRSGGSRCSGSACPA